MIYKLERNLRHFEHCAEAGRGGDRQEDGEAADTFYFVATDEASTQAAAKKVGAGTSTKRMLGIEIEGGALRGLIGCCLDSGSSEIATSAMKNERLAVANEDSIVAAAAGVIFTT